MNNIGRSRPSPGPPFIFMLHQCASQGPRTPEMRTRLDPEMVTLDTQTGTRRRSKFACMAITNLPKKSQAIRRSGMIAFV